ncbi:hypothetical protein CEXT_62961 [Caerostris extrusa]|uniref:Uncharacterized protein n=1 Tax=Caerostris extrusa TaxID=172846 RepID=A0AAV4XQY2_CAEEX|nr:hypothetical protein CEXT_62961 [Caerostris extrusa]
MESHQTVAEGREGGVNSKSFRTSERRNAPNLVTQDEALLAVLKFVPPQVPKRELMNTIHPSFSANYNLIRRSVEGLFSQSAAQMALQQFH